MGLGWVGFGLGLVGVGFEFDEGTNLLFEHLVEKEQTEKNRVMDDDGFDSVT